MRVAVLGARGMLATDLIASAPSGVDVVTLAHADLDITDSAMVDRLLQRERPDWIINASAYTQVDRAEGEVERAMAINGAAVARLGELCAQRSVAVVHYSTDYVFRGDADRPYREDDAVDPLNAYGRSKLAGERGLVDSGARALILRTQWLYGLAGKSFPRTMWDRATKGLTTRVVDDQRGRPTWTVDLARATWALVGAGATGLYHVAGGGLDATWFDVASLVFDAAGVPNLLAPCTSADYPTPAPRPRYSVLSTERIAADYEIVLPPWRDALTAFLRQLAENRSGTPLDAAKA